jgi:hypothetical protein
VAPVSAVDQAERFYEGLGGARMPISPVTRHHPWTI